MAETTSKKTEYLATGDISHGVGEGDEHRSLTYKADDPIDAAQFTEKDIAALLARGAIRPA